MHSLILSSLAVLLLVSTDVQQLVQLRLQEYVLKPFHIALQSCRLKVLHHLPHRRHHGVASVGEGRETHHHCQLFVWVPTAFQEVRHKDVHLRGQLEAVRFLRVRKDGSGPTLALICVSTALTWWLGTDSTGKKPSSTSWKCYSALQTSDIAAWCQLK